MAGTMWKAILVALIAIPLLALPAEAKKTKHHAVSPTKQTASKPRPPRKAPRAIGGFQTALECAKCHSDIYRNWEGSLHALSYKNPIFQAAYMKAYTETKGQAAKYCLGCHAPTVAATGDLDASADITKEGVTCDFCHSVTNVKLGSAEVFELKPGTVKRAALKDAEGGDYHGVAYSKDFATSRLCAGCHDFTNRNGVHVGRTHEEWQASSYAKEGTQCQTCHMPVVPGATSDSGGRDGINDHSLSHNTRQMKEAVTVETREAHRMNDELLVDVAIHNWKVGHFIPTGTPGRMLVLEVRTLDNSRRVIETKKTVYRKTVVDARGHELTTDGDAFLYGAKVKQDNRLAPDETRMETFRFSNRIRDVAAVEANAYFFFQPVVLQQVDMQIPLSTSTLPTK